MPLFVQEKCVGIFQLKSASNKPDNELSPEILFLSSVNNRRHTYIILVHSQHGNNFLPHCSSSAICSCNIERQGTGLPIHHPRFGWSVDQQPLKGCFNPQD